MSKPTLFTKGSLIPNEGDNADSKLDEYIPIEYIISWIKKRFSITAAPTLKDRVLILKSSTGSGKSVALPPTIFKEFFRPKQGSIVVTQPRVLTTISIVRDQIAKSGHYPYMKLEENLGWQTSSNRKMIHEGLMYMTLGVLIMQMKSMTAEELMSKYKFIIIDEVHEATVDLAAGMLLLKNIFSNNIGNKNLPFLILMSATFNTAKFLTYFGLDNDNLIQVAGHTFQKTIHWPNDKEGRSIISKNIPCGELVISAAELQKIIFHPGRKYTESAAIIAKKLHVINKDDINTMCDILIFLPGDKEIKDTYKYLNDGRTDYIILTINSDSVAKKTSDFINLSLPLEKVDKMAKRRIILSTVVAETGLTINTLKYVIDCGYNRTIEYNPFIGTGGLITKPAAQSRLIQRMGRIGRVSAGHYFPLFTKNSYDKFQKEQFSEAEVTDISDLILLSASFGKTRLDVPDSIPIDIISTSSHKLHLLGFLRPESSKFVITELGRFATKFPRIPVEYLRMIFGAYSWHLSILDAITITAYLTTESRFQASNKMPIRWREIYLQGLPQFFLESARPSSVKDKTKFIIVERVRLSISDNFLDAIFILNSIQQVIKSCPKMSDTINKIEEFCGKTGLSPDAIGEFLKNRDEIIEAVLTAGLNPFMGQSLIKTPADQFMKNITKWKVLFYESMRQNLAFYSATLGKYISIRGFAFDPPESLKIEYTIQPNGTPEIAFKRRPNLIIYEPAAKVVLKSNPNKPGEYIFKVERVSVLDGYVDIDNGFY